VSHLTILDGAEMLREMSRFFMDFLENEDFVNELMDQLMYYHFKVEKKLIELGVDILYIGDDAGAQHSMLVSPDMWHKYLKPRYDFLFPE
jgi:uroporphyrinogen decarboxylase